MIIAVRYAPFLAVGGLKTTCSQSICARVTLTARSVEIFLRLMDPIVLRHILLPRGICCPHMSPNVFEPERHYKSTNEQASGME